MADSKVNKVSPALLADAIDIIARAETKGVAPTSAALGPRQSGNLDIVPIQNHLAPQGQAGTVDAAMGQITLPRLIDLHSAILKVRGNLASAENMPDELSSTAISVLDEETLKIDRYLALRKR